MTPEKQDKTLELSKHWSADSTPARNELIMKKTHPTLLRRASLLGSGLFYQTSSVALIVELSELPKLCQLVVVSAYLVLF